MTELLFRDDAYLREAPARVLSADPRGIVLDRTTFYARGGGQPGDGGVLRLEDGGQIAITEAIYDADKQTILHVPAAGQPLPAPGAEVVAAIDWEPRLRRMRAHTALHLLSVVLPYPVTGGSVGDGEGRLDFNYEEGGLDKTVIADALNALIATNADVRANFITDEELAANPGLVKTMSVKPPTGRGTVRLIEIVGIDLQPCGGTHVARLGEIGRARVVEIEKKGRLNRRVRIALDP